MEMNAEKVTNPQITYYTRTCGSRLPPIKIKNPPFEKYIIIILSRSKGDSKISCMTSSSTVWGWGIAPKFGSSLNVNLNSALLTSFFQ
jgi:hypothetical protein